MIQELGVEPILLEQFLCNLFARNALSQFLEKLHVSWVKLPWTIEVYLVFRERDYLKWLLVRFWLSPFLIFICLVTVRRWGSIVHLYFDFRLLLSQGNAYF